MSRKIIIIVLVLLITSTLFSYYSDEYPIGTYTHYYNIENSIIPIATYLQDAHYNVVTDGYVADDELLIFDDHHIDVILGDRSYESKLRRATKSNYWEYEAEYYSDYNNNEVPSYDPKSVFPLRFKGEDAWPEEMWYYAVQRDFEEEDIFDPENFNNSINSKYFIRCEEGLGEGFVVDTLLYHSKEQNIYPQIGDYFYGSNYTYKIKYTMKIPEGEYPTPETEVCKIGLKMLREDDNGKIVHELIPLSGSVAELITLTKQDFDDASAIGDDFGTFEYSIPKYTMHGYNNFDPKWSRLNLCPVVWYSDNGTLEIDNVLITDTVFEALDDPYSTVSMRVKNRVNEYIGYQNVCGFAGTDEPSIPQFLANMRVKNLIEGEGSKLMCCVSLRGGYRADYYGYPHHNINRAYSYIVDPSQLMPDRYPSLVSIKWNTITTNKWSCFQGRIDKMNEVYVSTKNECLYKESKFYPIAQSFGRKGQINGEFIWEGYLLPPDESQKALCYLPLCYGSDGVFYYVFENMGSPNDPYEDEINGDPIHPDIDEPKDDILRYQVGLVNNYEDGAGWWITDQYYSVQESNAEILKLGEDFIKHLNWSEERTSTLMPDFTTINLDLGILNNVEICAYDPTGLNNHDEYSEEYEGYVECSVYIENDIPYFMLVNRRGNFPYHDFVDEDGNLIPEIIPDNTNVAFGNADPQEVTFYFSDLEPWREYSFTDMYEDDTLYQDHTIIAQVSETGELETSLPIEPGDGRLIRMSIHKSIPDTIDTQFTVPNNKHCLIDYTITVTESGTLVLNDGVTLHLDENSSFEVYGDIEIGNNVTFTSPDSVRWDGLYLFNTAAEIVMNNVTFERGEIHNDSRSLMISNSEFNNSGIEQKGLVLEVDYTNFDNSNIYAFRGGRKGLPPHVMPAHIEVDVNNCYFESCSDYAVTINNYPLYEFQNNVITNCGGGFDISNSGNPIKCIISDNNIHNNSWVGIWLHNSFADICERNKIENNYVGIVALDNSSITMIGNPDYPHSTIKDNMHQELIFDTSSFPTKISYNKVIDDAYTTGSHDQYLIRTIEFLFHVTFDIKDNYWGTVCENWNEGDGDSRFHPEAWYEYLPIWIPGPPVDPRTLTGLEELYAAADSLIQIEEYETAKQVYRDIIELYPESKYSIFSMRNLLPMETVSGRDFSTLMEYYLTEPNCNINDERTKLSQYLANYCKIKMEQYPEAISFFENIISDPDTELDSVYAVIDAGYTYLLMENEGKSGYIGKMAELKPKSEKEFRTMRDKLLSELFDIKEIDQGEPNVGNAFELNYNFPNPFNNSTTISFSLPISTQNAYLKIYNVRGQLVREFSLDTKSGIGSIAWDGNDSNGKRLGSGIYFYKLTVNQKETIKKMILMR
ncbi:MAG: T9SS type A sorting domain-containing protein [Candidatus Celaenobacter antarcticus]|nr:T9SS type A sorting domain-containing protein [Candidatus Celaenobacter antarcticus]